LNGAIEWMAIFSPAREGLAFVGDTLTKLARSCVMLGALAMLAGCSSENPTDNPFTFTRYASGKPTVWQCALVQMSSPPRYGCPDDKSYTAFQLHDFRVGTDTPVASK